MVHNFYRASRGLDTVSTVLGDVDFLGDHFMVGIYLFSPMFWFDSSAWMVLAVQAASLAATAPAIYGIARTHGAPWLPSAGLALATSLAFGLQSAAYFDAHAITVGFGFLAAGLWALERQKWWTATLLLAVFATFKESLGAYVAGLALLVLYRGWRDRSRHQAVFGAAWLLFGTLWFVLVNRVFMPALIARANPPEPHETFGDFGRTVFAALVGMLRDPLKALGAIVVPEEKALSLGVTLAGVGGLALGAGEILLPALPLLAERFLSSKATMWQMGYHYAAPLSLYAGWAAALTLPCVMKTLTQALNGSAVRASFVISLYLLLASLLVNAYGYRHPANFHRWTEDYFSSPPKQVSNQAAVDYVKALGPGVKVAAQNRILPHLADRPGIWRLGEYRKADLVVLSVGESAWPYPDRFPTTLRAKLEADAGWERVFEEGQTFVFVRRPTTP